MTISTLDFLFPPVAEKIASCAKIVAPFRFSVFETYRSFAAQMELYKKGRQLVNGVWAVVDKSQVVTNAQPGNSWHAYGLAADFAVDGNPQKQGIQWTWDDYDLTAPGAQVIPWDNLIAAVEVTGLESAAMWKSFPEMSHVQGIYGFTIAELKPILIKEGIETVWKKVMTKVPPKPMITVPNILVSLDENESTKKQLIKSPSILNRIKKWIFDS